MEITKYSKEEIENLIKELRFQYKRVNGRELKGEHDGEPEEWRVDMMVESIRLFKQLPSLKNNL